MKQHLTLPQLPKQDQSGNINQHELIHFLSAIQRVLSDKQREDYEAYSSISSIEQIEQHIIEKLYPVGERYIQLPEPDGTFSSAKSPEVKFGGEWTCIFDTEGVFFRTEGGLSAESRGGTGIQGFQLQWHNHLVPNLTQLVPNRTGRVGEWPKNDGNTYTEYTAYTGGNETRPINRLMRIWERIV